MNNITIGIAGTAKNTGKTTTTSAIMEQIKLDPKLRLAITSIGYDGEDLDNVTGLPKPRIKVWPGVIVAIAEKCLKFSEAKIEIIEQTNISTPLGKIIIGKVIKGGKILVAGPNKSKELRMVLESMANFGANITLVDGALNRIAPMVEVDGLILATGAAKNPEISELTYETKCIIDILQSPILEVEGHSMSIHSVLNNNGLDNLLVNFRNAETIDIQGIMGEKIFQDLRNRASEIKGKRILFTDPIKLVLAGETLNTYQLLKDFKAEGVEIGVKKAIRIIAVTLNPYYPKFRFTSEDYEPAYVDKNQLYLEMEKALEVPFYDVVQEGAQDILQNILDYWQDFTATVAK